MTDFIEKLIKNYKTKVKGNSGSMGRRRTQLAWVSGIDKGIKKSKENIEYGSNNTTD